MSEAAPRKGDWMQTATGRQFWPLDPRGEDVAILDIAHALSRLCRFGGHTRYFYSVAEHSVHVARHVPAEFQLAALMHDASEAYLVDIPRPIKPYLPGYAEAEDRLMTVIAERYGFQWPLPPEVKAADNRILVDERDQAMIETPLKWATDGLQPLGVKVGFWPPALAKERFLDMFERLM